MIQTTKNQDQLKKHLISLLGKSYAHMDFEAAVADFPEEHINTFPRHVPYTFWHLIEHLRINQRDILDFCQNSDYVAPEWPKAYWPDKEAMATKKQWDESINSFKDDLNELIKILEDPRLDLLAEIPWGDGQTYLREALLVADHNAYHIGELGILRQVLNNWSLLDR